MNNIQPISVFTFEQIETNNRIWYNIYLADVPKVTRALEIILQNSYVVNIDSKYFGCARGGEQQKHSIFIDTYY